MRDLRPCCQYMDGRSQQEQHQFERRDLDATSRPDDSDRQLPGPSRYPEVRHRGKPMDQLRKHTIRSGRGSIYRNRAGDVASGRPRFRRRSDEPYRALYDAAELEPTWNVGEWPDVSIAGWCRDPGCKRCSGLPFAERACVVYCRSGRWRERTLPQSYLLLRVQPVDEYALCDYEPTDERRTSLRWKVYTIAHGPGLVRQWVIERPSVHSRG